MNGESVFGWIKAIALLAILALLGYIAYEVMNWIKGGAKNPIGKAADTIVDKATGGYEKSVGGLFARFREWASGDTAKIEAMKKGGTSLPVGKSKPVGIDTGSVFVGDLPIGDIATNPRDAR